VRERESAGSVKQETDPIALDEVIALLEGELEGAAAMSVRERIAAGDIYRREYDHMRAIYADLAAMGEELAHKAPAVDLVAAVLAGVDQNESPHAAPERVVAFPERRRTVRSFSRAWGKWASGIAAAAVIALAVWLGRIPDWRDHKAFRNASENDIRTAMTSPDPSPHATSASSIDIPEMKALRDGLAHHARTPLPPAGESFEATHPVNLNQLSLQEIIETRRAALTDEGARMRLAQWARVVESQAKDIVANEHSTAEAIVGACASISDAEAEQALVQAVGRYPDNATAKRALALRYSNDDSAPAETAIALYRRLREQDPENAIWSYLEAREYAKQGKWDDLLTALEAAKPLTSASIHTQDFADARLKALLDAGVSLPVAQMVVALNAGQNERNFLCDLGKDLLQYGHQYAAAENPVAARHVFEALQRLGEQLNEGATYSQDRLAAYELQQWAIEGLAGLPLDASETEALTRQTRQLCGEMEGLGQLLSAVDKLFFGANDDSVLGLIAQAILQGGDLGLFESP